MKDTSKHSHVSHKIRVIRALLNQNLFDAPVPLHFQQYQKRSRYTHKMLNTNIYRSSPHSLLKYPFEVALNTCFVKRQLKSANITQRHDISVHIQCVVRLRTPTGHIVKLFRVLNSIQIHWTDQSGILMNYMKHRGQFRGPL